MERRSSSRNGTSRPRNARTPGRASGDLVGTSEDAGHSPGDTESIGNASAASNRAPLGGEQIQQPAGLVNKMKEQAATQLTTQKDRATEGISTLAQAVRLTTERLRDEQHDTVAEYVDKAAEQLERLSNTLREKDTNELLQDVRRLAVRQPALFIGGSFAVALVAARFFKSSRKNATSEYRSAAGPPANQPASDLPGVF